MKLFFFFLPAVASLTAAAASAPTPIVERRIWIETAGTRIEEDMCEEGMKAWRCLFDRVTCLKAMEAAFESCNPSVIPDLPEYIDGEATKAQAVKVVRDCMTAAVVSKYVVKLPKDKMEEYNICTGVAKRQKPLNPNMQKALDASKALAAPHCASGTYFRKCFAISEKECNDTIAKQHLDCSMKMEADGVSVKGDDASVQDAAGKISECGLTGMRKAFAGKKKSSHDADCE